MSLKYLVTGLFVKGITGFDDTIAQVPLVAAITRTRIGKIAFALGIFFAVIAAIIFSFFFAAVIKSIPYTREIATILLITLAILIFFNLLNFQKKKAGKKLKNPGKIKVELSRFQKKLVSLGFKPITLKRFLKLFITGFVAGIATVIDDTIAYSTLFLTSFSNSIFAIIGILLMAVIEVNVIIFFSRKISKIPHKNKIAAAGLLILALLIYFKVI